MKENILEVLVYLFEHHVEENGVVQLNGEALTDELSKAGFNIDVIDKAFDWLSDLSKSLESIEENGALLENGFRTLSIEEQTKIGSEWPYILHLEELGILDPISRELVLDRLMCFDHNDIDVHQVKWVTLMVLYNRGMQDSLKIMEKLVLEGSLGNMH